VTTESGYLDTSGGIYSLYRAGFDKAGYTDTFPSELSNRALMKARLKIKDSDINLAQAFAERAQTGRYVAGKIDNLAELIWAFKKRNFIAIRRYFTQGDVASRMLKDLQREWLELQYALRPLMGDIHGSVTALDKKNPADNYIVTAVARSSSKGKIDVTMDPSGVNSNSAHYKIEGDWVHGSYVRIDVCPDNAALATAASLGLTNPVHLGWELTRLSFVVDWAWPLGDYFSQFDALLGWKVKGYSTSNFSKVRAEVRRLGFTKTDGRPTIQDGSGSWYKVRLNRTASTSVPFATLPSVKNPASASHVMTSLALLRQACHI